VTFAFGGRSVAFALVCLHLQRCKKGSFFSGFSMDVFVTLC
jgi:hypothetical protein